MLKPLRQFASLAVLFACFACTTNVYAILCTPLNSPKYYVGPASDGVCTDNDIGSAVAKTSSASCPVTVYVTNEQSYSGEHVSISTASHGLTVVGVGGTCSVPTIILCDPTLGCGGGAPQVAIGGDGANPVISISGNGSVLLANLAISGGQGADGSFSSGGGVSVNGSSGTSVTLNNVAVSGNNAYAGAGIAYSGAGSLHLQGAYIHDNHASNSGGGVSIYGTSASTTEFAIADVPGLLTDIAGNVSGNGGGIYASGNVHLLIESASQYRIRVEQNTAANGGGIYFAGTAFADIGPGAADTVYQNHATQDGGGIYIATPATGSAVLRLFATTSPANAAIDGNKADRYGGALYIAAASASSHATACLFDPLLASNEGDVGGAAVFVDDGGRLVINADSDSECDFAAVAALGAVHGNPLALGANDIAANSSGGSAAAAIEFTGAAEINATRLRVFENKTGYGLHGTNAANATVTFSQCIFDYNTLSGALVSLQGVPASFDSCTFADNTTATPIFSFDSGLTLTRSIVHQGSAVFPSPATGLTAQYLLLDGPIQLIGNTTVEYGTDPAFVNEIDGDFHLQSTSSAIDFAPVVSPESVSGDFDRQPRVVDLSNVTNLHGPRDLGAYEYQVGGVLDRIFMGSFDP